VLWWSMYDKHTCTNFWFLCIFIYQKYGIKNVNHLSLLLGSWCIYIKHLILYIKTGILFFRDTKWKFRDTKPYKMKNAHFTSKIELQCIILIYKKPMTMTKKKLLQYIKFLSGLCSYRIKISASVEVMFDTL
jgi:hypothetical protein